MILAALAVLVFLAPLQLQVPETHPVNVVVVVDAPACPEKQMADVTITTSTISYDVSTSSFSPTASGAIPRIGCVFRFTPVMQQGEIYDLRITYTRDDQEVEALLGSVMVDLDGPPPATHVYFVEADDLVDATPTP